LCKLGFFLVFLPFSVTFLHLQYQFRHVHLCHVTPPSYSLWSSLVESPTQQLYGTYAYVPPKYRFGPPEEQPPGLFTKVSMQSHWWQSARIARWPSMAIMSSQLLLNVDTKQTKYQISQFDSANHKAWCILQTFQQGDPPDPFIYCSPDNATISASTINPPAGIWEDTKHQQHISPVHVSCTIPWSSSSSSSYVPSFFSFSSSKVMKDVNRNVEKKYDGPSATYDDSGNRNIRELFDHPATTLLVAINVGLAYWYWNHHVDPSSVSKIYSRMVGSSSTSESSIFGATHTYELWRSFTGALAHFELLHLGFNMMSLYSLGLALEQNYDDNTGYTSIAFWLYNVSLIPLTTMILMAIIWIRIQYKSKSGYSTPQQLSALRDTSTVGYSGVLFAWMVVVSLEQPQSCPIPFLSNLCFTTYSFWEGHFKFNVGPIVQLFFCQFIMPRVSFMGHLAGILAGFALHWNFLPLEIVQPCVLVPLLFGVHLWKVRHLVPVPPSAPIVQIVQQASSTNDTTNQDDEEAAPLVQSSPARATPNRRQHPTNRVITGGRTMSSSTSSTQRTRDAELHHYLLRCQGGMLLTTLIGLWTFEILWLGSLFWSQILSGVFFMSGVSSHQRLLNLTTCASTPSSRGAPAEISCERQRLGTLWRGYIISSVLLLLMDSMTLGGWWSVFRGLGTSSCPLWMASGALVVRMMVHITSICLVCKNIADNSEMHAAGAGIFNNVFGYTVLDNGRIVGNAITKSSANTRNSSHVPFEGRGNILGSS